MAFLLDAKYGNVVNGSGHSVGWLIGLGWCDALAGLVGFIGSSWAGWVKLVGLVRVGSDRVRSGWVRLVGKVQLGWIGLIGLGGLVLLGSG